MQICASNINTRLSTNYVYEIRRAINVKSQLTYVNNLTQSLEYDD